MENITIIIKCKNDPHVLKTIRSIDYPAEIIVPLVPNPGLKLDIESLGVRVVDVPDNNIGISCQVGLRAAQNDACIITDSDTVFGHSYIASCLEALQNNDICRGKIIFQQDPAVNGSDIVAKVRDYINNIHHPPYMPGLCLRRSFVKKIGGFDPDIRWGVDHELGERAFAASARYAFLESVSLEHVPISIEHDLHAAFRTGQGLRHLDRKKQRRRPGLFDGWIYTTLSSLVHEPYCDIIRHGGMRCGVHHFTWVMKFNQGYWKCPLHDKP